jgi:hypothetical protein
MKPRFKSVLTAALILTGATVGAFGYNVRLSQIDPSRLLLSQSIRLYVSVTDDRGLPV